MKIFSEKASGKNADRPALRNALNHLRDGDVFVVWKLDCLGRSVKNLMGFVEQRQEQVVQFCSLTDVIDATTPAGRFFSM